MAYISYVTKAMKNYTFSREIPETKGLRRPAEPPEPWSCYSKMEPNY